MTSFIRKDIFFNLDSIIYGLINNIYQLFFTLSRTTILSQETIKIFADRVYAVIGVFMLFKVAFSLLGMFADPDKLNDSKAGGGKLVTRIVTSLLLFALVPTIFSTAYALQGAIIRENILGNIILGTKTGTVKNQTMEEIQEVAGKRIAVSVFSGFFRPVGTLSAGNQTKYDAATNYTNPDFYQFSDLVNAKADSGTGYAFNYSYFISTIAGVLIALIILSFCFDIAIRSVKLAFLQLIAPIPILSYIDIKSGEKTFNNWVSACVSTYVDVFVRLGIIFFIVFIISELTSGPNLFNIYDVTTGKIMPTDAFAISFVIMGLLLFAKEAPDLIYNILGIKKSGNGGFSLNPMNRIRQVPGVGRAVTSAQARAGGAVSGAIGGLESGHMLRGAFAGQGAAAKEVAKKVGWAGSKDGKSVQAMSAGARVGYKDVTGKDYSNFSSLTIFGAMSNQKYDAEIAPYKKTKGEYKNAQSVLDSRLGILQDKYKQVEESYKSGAISQEDYVENRTKIEAAYTANRKQFGTYAKNISDIDDQIGDIKKFYRADDSTKRDMKKIAAGVSTISADLTNLDPNALDLKMEVASGATNEATVNTPKRTVVRYANKSMPRKSRLNRSRYK